MPDWARKTPNPFHDWSGRSRYYSTPRRTLISSYIKTKPILFSNSAFQSQTLSQAKEFRNFREGIVLCTQNGTDSGGARADLMPITWNRINICVDCAECWILSTRWRQLEMWIFLLGQGQSCYFNVIIRTVIMLLFVSWWFYFRA